MLYGEMQSNTPSQFLDDIPAELMEIDERAPRSLKSEELGYAPIPYEDYDDIEGVILEEGDKVAHHTFGEATVVSVTGGVATIAFNNPKYGLKKLALSIAPLKKIG